jgi:hypothetical protein
MPTKKKRVFITLPGEVEIKLMFLRDNKTFPHLSATGDLSKTCLQLIKEALERYPGPDQLPLIVPRGRTR